MIKAKNRKEHSQKRHRRIRVKLSGTTEAPRLAVYRSTKHIYAQLIDDVKGVTLCAASSIDKDLNVNGGEIITVISKESRSLEYKLNGYDEGIFVRIEFISDPKNIKVINRTMTLSEASLWHKICRNGGLAFGCKSSYQCY
jgi:large subunit ribosomal protein L18